MNPSPSILDIQEAVCRPISLHRIKVITCAYFGVELNALLSKRRQANLGHARRVAWVLSRDLTTKSYPAIGMSFDRDHTSILHGVQVITQQMTSDESVRRQVEAVRRQVVDIAAGLVGRT